MDTATSTAKDHPGKPVTRTGQPDLVNTDGTRDQHYQTADGERWVCVMSGQVPLRWVRVK